MPVYRMQVAFGADSALPRDRFIITPHFRQSDPGGVLENEPQGLVDDLAAALAAWNTVTREISVKAYDAERTPIAGEPGRPLAEALLNANTYPLSNGPREMAVCLSFYSEFNSGRRRGRLYVPGPIVFSGGGIEARPSAAQRTFVSALVPIFTDLGGADVDWCVWSRADRTARPVTHWFVDDEWDVQRRRGLRSNTRTVGTTEEAGAIVTP
jgi:hypothetical protein